MALHLLLISMFFYKDEAHLLKLHSLLLLKVNPLIDFIIDPLFLIVSMIFLNAQIKLMSLKSLNRMM